MDNIPHGRVEQVPNSAASSWIILAGFTSTCRRLDDDRGRRFGSLYVHDGGEYLERAKMVNVLDSPDC